MATSTSTTVRELNEQLADKLIAESLNNPQSPFFGKFVGLANGQVVAITNDLDDLVRCLRQAEPDPTRTYFFEGGRDYSIVEEIWRMG